MRVGILTFQWSDNYGAALQAYALKKYLNELGIDSYIIDYRKKYKRRKMTIINRIKGVILKLLLLRDNKKIKNQKNNFKAFKKDYFNLTKIYNCLNDLNDIDFDCIICGSDQIWNPNLTGGKYDSVYFANFKTRAKKIAYAASIGEKSINKNDEKEFIKLINNFDYISVRESHLVNNLSEYTKKKIINVLDPTLLLTKKDYIKISSDRIINKPYVLIYQNTKNDDVYKIAKEIACKKNISIVEVGYRRQFPDTGIPIIQDAGPKEFLSLYKDADFVVTNTFHGTVFAIQFEKDFVSIPLVGRESRVKSLVEILGLNDRIINKYDDFKRSNLLDENIDYKIVNNRLSKARKESELFLKEAIKED